MRKTRNLLVWSVFAVIGFSLPAHAADFFVGLGGAYVSSPYKAHGGSILPTLPVSYEGERFYAHVLGAGVYLWKGERQDISVGLAYAALSFNADKTDDNRLKRIENRYDTINAAAQYRLRTDFGHLGVQVARDILGHSSGFSADVSYKYPFSLGPVYLIPGAGLRWDSKEQVDYYYGVSGKEAHKSGLGKYSPDSALSPYLSLAARWAFADNWSLTAGGEVQFLGSEIKNSPVVDKAQIFSAAIAVMYTF